MGSGSVYYGGGTWSDVVSRYGYLIAQNQAPDNNQEDQAGYTEFQTAQGVLGRNPTPAEFSGIVSAYASSGATGGLTYLNGLASSQAATAAQAKADAQTAAATPSNATIASLTAASAAVQTTQLQVAQIAANQELSAVQNTVAGVTPGSNTVSSNMAVAPQTAPAAATSVPVSGTLILVVVGILAVILLKRGKK